jgi:hypothetical protein
MSTTTESASLRLVRSSTGYEPVADFHKWQPVAVHVLENKATGIQFPVIETFDNGDPMRRGFYADLPFPVSPEACVEIAELTSWSTNRHALIAHHVLDNIGFWNEEGNRQVYTTTVWVAETH